MTQLELSLRERLAAIEKLYREGRISYEEGRRLYVQTENEMRTYISRQQYAEQMYERQRFQGMPNAYGPGPQGQPVPVYIPKESERTPEEIKKSFLEVLASGGMKKDLTVTQKVQHEMQLGELEKYQAAKKPEEPKRLCGVCHDPTCPWSD